MPNVDFAERILSLVTTRDRATSIAGDLMEGTPGAIWFWFGVARTGTALLGGNVAAEPVRLTGLAFVSLAAYIGIELIFAFLSGLAFFGTAVAGHPLYLDSLGWKLWFAAPVLIGSLLTGRILAHWAPRRELAACAVCGILVSIYNLLPIFGDHGVLAALACILIMPAGAAWGRARRLRTT